MSISLETYVSSYEVKIFDNGSTSPKDYKTSGLGMNNMKSRTKSMNGTLEILQDDGFLIHVIIPKR